MSAGPRRTRSTDRKRLSDKSGFTLVEVLVAFTVLATLLSVLFRGVVSLRGGSVVFDDQTTKQIIARAVFEEALAQSNLANGRYTGVRNGLRWTLVAKPIDLSRQLPRPQNGGSGSGAAAAPPAQQQKGPAGSTVAANIDDAEPMWSLQRLTVRIQNRGRAIEVETIRLVKAEKKE